MDKCTHEVCKQYWKNIIGQCLQRPEGMTAKQWLDSYNENAISCKKNFIEISCPADNVCLQVYRLHQGSVFLCVYLLFADVVFIQPLLDSHVFRSLQTLTYDVFQRCLRTSCVHLSIKFSL